MLRWFVVCLVGAMSLVAAHARAWVETSVRSSATTVTVAETGVATVSHEWLIRVKGGPLRNIVVEDVDDDAALLDGASIVRASSGQVAGVPVALTGTREGQTLRLDVAYNKGLPSGSYLLRFTYATNLQERGSIRAAGPMTAVEWQSPSYREGIDSLKARFIFARGAVPPSAELTPSPPSGHRDGVQVVSTDSGVFLSELQREADSDILTLTRPHVARRERVTWRMFVSPETVGQSATTTVRAPAGSLPPKTFVPPPQRAWPYAMALSFATLFTLLLGMKLRNADYAPLIDWRKRYRLPAVYFLISVSLWLALVPEWPSLAACALFAACVLSLTRMHYERPPARGPGEWRKVSPDALPFVPVSRSRGARWLDVGSLPGLFVFLLLTGAAALLGLRMIGVSPYYSATALFYAMAFVPLFFTVGGKRRLSPLDEQLTFLAPLQRRFPKALGYGEFIGRYPAGSDVPDELRLRVRPASPRPGFRRCEVALECTQGAFGRILTPAVMVQVDDQSEAHRSLPKDGQWSRGRHPEDRIVVLRPRLPIRSVTTDLVLAVLKQVSRNRPKRQATAKDRPAVATSASARA